MKDLGSLKHLDVSHNKLTHVLDNQFASLSSIESINMSHNEINSIQQFTFTDLKALQKLDLASNKLQTDEFLEQTVRIKSIDLQNNQYHEMNLSAFKSVGSVYLNKNPWNCSWLLRSLSKKEHLISNIQFGFEFDDFPQENVTKPLLQEVECLDYRQSTKWPLIRKIVVINEDCAPKNEKKVIFFLIIFIFHFFFQIFISLPNLFYCFFFSIYIINNINRFHWKSILEKANNKHIS